MTEAPPILVVNGVKFDAWTSASLRKSLDEFSRAWSVEFTDRWAPEGEAWAILPGNEVQFLAGSHILDSGYVTRTNWSSSALDYTVTAEGRSRTCDLVDCAPLAGDTSDQVKGLTPFKLAQKLAEPFGITVLDESGDNRVLTRFNIELGETCFEAIDRVCRSRGILPSTTPEGFLLLQKAGVSDRTVDVSSDLAATRSLEYSEENRFSEYFVYGQHPGEEKFRGDKILNQAGRDFDGIVARNRPTVILAESPASKEDLDRQATWERNVRMGRSEVVRYRVAGILAPDGDPWEPGMLARLQDDVIRVHSTLLVKSVSHTWDANGQWTDLELTRPEAYTTEPIKGKDSKGAW